MIKNKRHTLLKMTGKCFSRVLGMLLILSFIPFWGFAQASSENNVVYKADGDKVIITSGKITATEGQSIRLLPGTHIQQGEQLVVDITNKAHQEALAEALAKEKEAEMLQLATRFNELLTNGFSEKTQGQLDPNRSPIDERQLGVQNIKSTATLSNLNNNVKLPSWQIIEFDSTRNHKNLALTKPTINYTPNMKWGNRAESVKVLRC